MEARPWHRFYRPGSRTGIDDPHVPVTELVLGRARADPDLPALIFGDRTTTYRELAAAIAAVAAGLLRLGLAAGDRVLLMLPNCPAYVTAYYGALAAGGIVVPVNPLYTPREVAHIAADSGARVAVLADVTRERAAGLDVPIRLVADLGAGGAAGPGERPLEALFDPGPATAGPGTSPDPESVAVLQYTGGTTGLPKGAMLTHRNLVANVLQMVEAGAPGEPGDSRILTVLPLSHVFGMTCCMHLGLHRGACLILFPRFDIDAIMPAIRRHRVTAFPGVPTMYVAVLNYPDAESYGIDQIRSISSGGAAMPQQVADTFQKRFGAEMSEGFGLTEASPVTHGNPSWAPGLRRPGSIGIPLPDTDARIVDLETGTSVLPPGEVGELCIRGPQVMRGYWHRPQETAAALREGWLYTGDVARMDADGYFYIVDRKKDVIIVSGYNVYPREVEEVLYAHPDVAEAAVVGEPDPYRGEAVRAYVVPRPDRAPAPEDLVAFCRERLAPFKVPRRLILRDALPKSGAGKVLRRTLREGDDG